MLRERKEKSLNMIHGVSVIPGLGERTKEEWTSRSRNRGRVPVGVLKVSGLVFRDLNQHLDFYKAAL